MPPSSQDKKNSLQSVVDSIQTQTKKESLNTAQGGYIPNPNLKSLRTFQGDMQERIEDKKETVSTIALAEQKKKIEQNIPTYTERQPSSSHAGLFVILGIIFFVIGGSIFGAIYFLKTESESVVKTNVENSLIPYTHKKDFNIQSADTSNIASVLLLEKSSLNSEINTVIYASYLKNGNKLDSREIINAVFGRAGDSLKRNVDEIMTGIYSYDTNEIFFVVRPDEFGSVYSGMLEWENSMASDLSPFFPNLDIHVNSHEVVFIDETYKNKDVRLVRNSTGNTVLVYGFIDRKTLVITANEKLFQAILNKYLQGKLSR